MSLILLDAFAGGQAAAVTLASGSAAVAGSTVALTARHVLAMASGSAVVTGQSATLTGVTPIVTFIPPAPNNPRVAIITH